MSAIIVRVKGQGSVSGETVTKDDAVDTTCSECGVTADAVVSIGQGFICASCVRERLDAMSVARYQLRGSSKLPWGKLTS